MIRHAVKAPVFTAAGHLLVEGTNSIDNIEVRRWAGEVYVRVARTLGIELPRGESQIIRIAVSYEDFGSSSNVVTEEIMDRGVHVRRLKIGNLTKVVRSQADEALCKLLLESYAASRRPGSTEPAPAATNTVTSSVPGWFHNGMSRYIYHDLRAGDVDAVLRIWKKGQLKPFPEFLDSAAGKKDYPYESVYGTIIAWLASLPDRQIIFGKMFDQLASGGGLSSAWFAKNIPGCVTVSDVDEAWENWVISQWRVVYRLGVATPLQVDELKERLVLQHDDAAMPLSANINMRIDFKALVDMKPEGWLPAALRSKISELQILSMGKGPDFKAAVDSYSKFLEAVIAGRKAGRLKDLLEKAEADFEKLSTKVAEGDGVSK